MNGIWNLADYTIINAIYLNYLLFSKGACTIYLVLVVEMLQGVKHLQ